VLPWRFIFNHWLKVIVVIAGYSERNSFSTIRPTPPHFLEINMANTILVTGASGNIGRELVRELKSAGADVIAGSSSGKSVADVPSRKVDFNDTDGLRAAFSGIDTLFLLLPLVENKFELARNAVAAARAAGVRHIVRSSGAGADATTSVALLRLQGQIDQVVIDSGIAYTLLRPSTFMQNFAVYYAGMIQGGALYLPQAEGRVAYIDVRDIASVAATVLQNPGAHAGQAYTLTGAESLSNTDAIRIIGAAIGKTVDYVAVPDSAAIASMEGMGMGAWSIDQMMSLNRFTAAGSASGKTDTVRELLGRAPIAFADFVADHRSAWVAG
jgi:uncharacterized protein YbjT (DUF2867 family)